MADVGEDALLVHDPARADPGLAFSLAKLAETPTAPTPIGIFRQRAAAGVSRATRPPSRRRAQLADLLTAGDTWTVA